MATMATYEESKSYEWIADTVEALAVSSPMHEVFTDLHTRGYDAVMDNMMVTLHGSEELIAGYDTTIATKTVADMILTAFLEEKAPYIRQCLAYIDAEYNPIENYAGHEYETIDDTIGEVYRHGTHAEDGAQDVFTKGPTETSYDYPERTDSVKIGKGQGYDIEFHEAKKSSVTTADLDGEQITKVAPEDSETYYNKEKVTQKVPGSTVITSRVPEGGDGGKDTTHYTQREDETKYGDHIDQVKTIQVTDQVDYSARGGSQDETIDEHTVGRIRELTKSGNIGVLTASEMLSRDRSFWEAFNWLSQLTLQLCERVCQGVMSL